MTVRTIMSNETESNNVAYHGQRFLIRKGYFRVNDVFNMQCYKHGKPVLHVNNKKSWVVTLVMDSTLLPLEKGFTLIGFRELA